MLLRKAIIVLLARLVSQALVQISAFVVAMLLFLLAHAVWQPYSEPRFALAEGLSLLTLCVTATLAINAQPAAGATFDTIVTVNVLIVLINCGALALLLWNWTRLCCRKHAATATRVVRVVRPRLSKLAAGIRTGTGRSSLPAAAAATATSAGSATVASKPSTPATVPASTSTSNKADTSADTFRFAAEPSPPTPRPAVAVTTPVSVPYPETSSGATPAASSVPASAR